MSKVFVLRGRKILKTLEDEVYDPILYTFAEVYAEREAAIGALKAHLEDSLPELQELVPGASVQSLLESGENDDYGWRYMEYDEVSETSPDVAEWALTSEDAAMFYGPHEFILPYFVVQLLEIQ